jgi:hypothetical protein
MQIFMYTNNYFDSQKIQNAVLNVSNHQHPAPSLRRTGFFEEDQVVR